MLHKGSIRAGREAVLLDHFALTATGPLFCPRICDVENSSSCREVSFTESILLRGANQQWIELLPGQSHRLQSSLNDPLPAGRHSLRVRYSVVGPAESMIADCQGYVSRRLNFWRGNLLSNVVDIEVNVTSERTHDALVGMPPI